MSAPIQRHVSTYSAVMSVVMSATTTTSNNNAENDRIQGGGEDARGEERPMFTPEETPKIIQLMKELPVDRDVRVDKSVQRSNFFDDDSFHIKEYHPQGKYNWILDRIRAWYRPGWSLQEFQSRIDFILMHEFDSSDFFDWHVDTKPCDRTGRNDNINVLLSNPKQFEAGALQAGSYLVPALQGGCYSYPAAYPGRYQGSPAHLHCGNERHQPCWRSRRKPGRAPKGVLSPGATELRQSV